MVRWIIMTAIPLVLAGCISSSNPPPPQHDTVVVPPATTVEPPATTVCSDGTYPPCNY